MRCHADLKYSGTHDNTQARITESPRRSDDSDDHIHGFSVGFSDRWWEPMTRRIRETDPPSPQSAADSKTGSSSSSATAARSSNGRVGGALVSQPRLLQFPLSIHNSPILFCLSPPAAAFARASPPAHLTWSSERAAERHGPLVEPERFLPRRSALLIVRPEPRPRRCCFGEPGQPPPRPHPPIFCASPPPPPSAAALPRQHLPIYFCASPASPPLALSPARLPRPRRPRRQHPPLLSW